MRWIWNDKVLLAPSPLPFPLLPLKLNPPSVASPSPCHLSFPSMWCFPCHLHLPPAPLALFIACSTISLHHLPPYPSSQPLQSGPAPATCPSHQPPYKVCERSIPKIYGLCVDFSQSLCLLAQLTRSILTITVHTNQEAPSQYACRNNKRSMALRQQPILWILLLVL